MLQSTVHTYECRNCVSESNKCPLMKRSAPWLIGSLFQRLDLTSALHLGLCLHDLFICLSKYHKNWVAHIAYFNTFWLLFQYDNNVSVSVFGLGKEKKNQVGKPIKLLFKLLLWRLCGCWMDISVFIQIDRWHIPC